MFILPCTAGVDVTLSSVCGTAGLGCVLHAQNGHLCVTQALQDSAQCPHINAFFPRNVFTLFASPS